MKARRKSDGKIISVEAIVYNAKNGERYSPSELDFNVDAEDTVIQGWVGRDMSGSLYVYCHEPERNLMKCLWEGDIMSISLSDDMFPDLTWDSEPIKVSILIKRE